VHAWKKSDDDRASVRGEGFGEGDEERRAHTHTCARVQGHGREQALEGLTGLQQVIMFLVYQGNKRQSRAITRGLEANTGAQARTISLMMRDVEPGDYVVVPCTQEPVEMSFYMRFWSKEPIELIDTRGGKDWKIANGSVDQIDRADR
jgi:hypothetical protein